MAVGRRRWIDGDIEKLRRLARTMPTAQIAVELERGISATIMKAHKLGISLRLKPKTGSRAPLITPPPPRLQ
jgi:hypothetical protein